MPEQDWIEIAGGSGWMGGGPRREENPRHRVSLSPYRLARTPVTRAEYQAFLDDTRHEPPPSWDDPALAHPRMPATAPSWDDAVAYCAWISELWSCEARFSNRATSSL